ncbi:Aste57867_8752 [Aphanomyces stellatus]|uniref:Aste57867_8752 protein n=1 Tax=Aphanomyces stellatus TaxID=120398 RepID=A0A485KLD6_9STRA|nr:hypothetical protein As57867_008718 [Aphanomyces stellatus]VFT85638.1 Aste57867_8752 [Aphanomyces stellatus]
MMEAVANVPAAVSAYFSSLSRSETNQVKTRSEGELSVQSGITVVTKQRGKALHNVGFHKTNKLQLYPEEATCLAHRGVLDIYASNDLSRVLSLREISDRLHVHVPRECREVYCFLKERQFIPRRHRGHNIAHIPRVSTAEHVEFAYDVYGPGKKAALPLFRAIVCRMTDSMPDIEVLLQQMGDDDVVPVKIFVCDAEGGVLPMEIGKLTLETS